EGHITAYSEIGLGTTFNLYLPRGTAEPLQSSGKPAVMTTGVRAACGETILVVEDNPTIRSMVVKQLVGFGYAVVEAENAAQALHLAETTAVDLLFTDMVMPGEMKGKQLAKIAQFMQPKLKVLFTSGFPGSADSSNVVLQSGDVLLKKPYRRDELAAAIRDVLDDCPGEGLQAGCYATLE